MTSPMKPPQTNQSMHPQDKKNLIIFAIAAMSLWFLFDHFVMGPRADALQKAREEAAQNAPQAVITQKVSVPDEEIILPREDRLEQNARIVIDSPELKGSISLKGGRIDDISLKHFSVGLEDDTSVVLMSPSGSDGAHYTESGWLSADTSLRLPDQNTVWSVNGDSQVLGKDAPVTLTWDNGNGLIFSRTYSIDDHFMFNLSQSVENRTDKNISLYPYISLARRGIPKDFSKTVAYEGPLGYIGDEMYEIGYEDLFEGKSESHTALNGWIGFGEKYWLSAIIPSQMSEHTYRFQAVPNKKNESLTLFQLDARGSEVIIPAGGKAEESSNIFIGAKKLSLLNDYQSQLSLRHFDLAVDFGVLYFLTKPLYTALIFFNDFVGNFGVAIILLTICVRLLVFPLASKSYRSFAALRKVSPRMAEIKARYGNDKPRMQQELVKLYEKEKVNPMAGCFPLLLQIPIFFAVYKVITIAVEMRHAPFFGWIHDLSAHDPLSVFNLFGALPYDVPGFMMIGPWSLVMLVMLLIQKHLNPPPQDQIQRDIANYMPWIMTYMLSHFASGLVIYWAFSNIFSVCQQAYIMRSMGVPIYLFSPDAAREHHDSHKRETEKVLEAVQKEKDGEASPEISDTSDSDKKDKS
ncbi:MAG: membrane protein insertase YidC [Pseudobdellovibrionaceae bacterium]|nr:membrane protein insertase YidC [Pseudobdellovibrionaceae bacterium]